MSRYTTDRNGITIGWDNSWFFRDIEDQFHDFGSILVFEGMYPDQANTLNYDLKSFATQLCWKPIKHIVKDVLGEHEFDREVTEMSLKSWYRKWLDNNAPDWGTPPFDPRYCRERPSIFFKKVSQARQFRALIAEHLKGMPSVRTATLWGKKD